jgi:uncharacterized protein (DUF427 family)
MSALEPARRRRLDPGAVEQTRRDAGERLHPPAERPPNLRHHRELSAGQQRETRVMKAVVDGQVVAQSNDIVECKGYQYFPSAAVRMDWLEKAAKTESDHACPHGVQFYDVVVAGKRHQRAAWSYEAPRPEMKQVSNRFGFWQDVEVS